MQVVLGIDAAWTAKAPSGVALAVDQGGGWKLVTAEPSYDHFLAFAAEQKLESKPCGRVVHATDLIEAVRRLVGKIPDLVAIDMPLALTPIEARRGADAAISRSYGKQWCSTHSPSNERPGPISDQLRQEFAALGFPLCLKAIVTPGLIEVYPHPALVELAAEPRRLPYKIGKIRTYWPNCNPARRRQLLLAEWQGIGLVLENYLAGSADRIGARAGNSATELKSHEDMLDAIVCCVCGIRALQGAAKAYSGEDDASAIWVPLADLSIQKSTLLPSSPYSARAEMRRELIHDDLMAGEYPELFEPPS